MNQTVKIPILLLVILFMSAGSAFALPVIDGNMSTRYSEWHNRSTYESPDETQDSNPDRIGPGRGGQLFDVERIGIKSKNSRVYFGLQTGFDIKSGQINYQGRDYFAGDIFIDFDGDDSWEISIDPITLAVETGGKFVRPQFIRSSPYDRINGTQVAQATGTTEQGTNEFGETIYTLEGYFDLNSSPFLAAYSVNPLTTIHWTMSCGNDVLRHTVPEPGSILILGTGLVGLLGLTRKRFF